LTPRALVLLTAGILSAQSSSIPPTYNQVFRPQFHFSPRENWTNDPNGLVYFEDEYHLFFQYNPFGDEWGHMSWGHAVSRDLVHWQQLPVAIPEPDGIMIFTGSTVIDERNTSGFCKNSKPCMVAIYTGHRAAAGGRPALQTQNLAYSNDKGRTWRQYSGNPVLNLHMTDFRDPKVFWSLQANRWTMVVSLPNEHKVRIYGSSDLKHWAALSDFGPAGATGGQWECPELFELPIEGGQGETRWVLKIGLNPGSLQGGSGEQYFIGRFDGKRFTNDNPDSRTLWTDYGKDCYCALTFNNLPRSERTVMIGWMDNWQYAGKLPTGPWRGQMTFPRSLALRRTPEGIRLIQTPIAQLANIEPKRARTAGNAGTIASVNRWLTTSGITSDKAFQLKSDISLGTAREVGWKLLASNGNYTLVGYDRKERKLFFDRTHSGLTNFDKNFPDRTEAPLTLDRGILRLNILVDRSSVEVFAEDGRVASTNLVFPPSGITGAQVYANGGETGEITASASSIQSIWISSK